MTKLNADNYMAWAHSMEIMLDAKELFRLVDGTEPMPNATARPRDHKAWTFDDKQARMWIHTNCEDQQHAHIEHSKTSKAAWDDALRQVHGTYSQGRLYFLKTKFFLYKAGASEGIEDVKKRVVRNSRHDTERPSDRSANRI